jgi:hypothetical protein
MTDSDQLIQLKQDLKALEEIQRDLSLIEIARALSGKLRGKVITAPLPGPRFRQVIVALNPMAPDGWIARPDRAGDASIAECREYVKRRIALYRFKNERPRP